MDNYDKNAPEPYGASYWEDFIYIAVIIGTVLLGYFLPKWLG
jgi:hypothetical protein